MKLDKPFLTYRHAKHALKHACAAGLGRSVRLMSSDSFLPVDEAENTHTHAPKHTQNQVISTYTRIFSVISHGRESRRACVSDVFSSESLWLPYRSSSFFCHPSCSSSKPPSSLFYLQVQSSLCPLVLSSMQFYSVSSPPFISAYCSPPHTCTLLHLPSAWPNTTTSSSCTRPCLSSTTQTQGVLHKLLSGQS